MAHDSEAATVASSEGSAAPLRMTRRVYDEIRYTIGCLPAETGGMLGGCRKTGLITSFYFDGTAARSGVTYSPDTREVNRVLSKQWAPRGVELLGFVHSHPPAFNRPSGGDVAYAHAILRANPPVRRLALPIVTTMPDAGAFSLQAYAALASGERTRIEPSELDLIDGQPSQAADDFPFRDLRIFERVRSAYDLDRLEHSRIIAIGCGGAASFIEDLARIGVGEFVLIDPDIVSETNIATQQTYRSDIGRPKVDCIADRIRDINPSAFVAACWMSLDDINDVEFCHLARTPMKGHSPDATLICGMTDSFYVQARVNRLALNFRLPSLCAQVYEEGRGAEVTFTHPETTTACHRCILASRYRAYLEDGFVNSVGSTGTPYYATYRLNALKQFVALSLLHCGASHPRWGRMLESIGQRNFLQLRLAPDVPLPAIEQTFAESNSDRFFCDDVVWLKIPPNLMCPDCGGISIR